jgi:chromosome segregation ATPase
LEQEINHFSQLATRYKKGKISWEQQANLLNTKLQEATEELTEQEELLDSKNVKIVDLIKELNQQKQENSQQKKITAKKNFSLGQKTVIISKLKKDKVDLQVEVQKLKTDKQDLANKLANQDQKISDLETQLSEKEQEMQEKDRIIAELRNKPSIQPVNNPDKSEKDNFLQPEPNNFLTEKEELLKTVQQQKTTIEKLQTQLQQAQEPQIITKEVPKTDLTVIKQLQAELRNKEQTITQLHIT